MNSEDESEVENEAIENGVDNDLQTLSIVASGLFFHSVEIFEIFCHLRFYVKAICEFQSRSEISHSLLML